MTQLPETPNNRLDRLEAANERFAELTIQNIQRHDENFFRIEGELTDLSTQINQLGSQVEAMTTSTTELVRTMAEMAVLRLIVIDCSIGKR